MTRLRPFRALRYDPERVDLARVIAPPYDVVAPDEHAGLYDGDPHNAIRLELPREPADESARPYAAVRRVLDDWRRSGVLIRDRVPALYGLRQCFAAPDGTPRVREGFFALLRLEDYKRGLVRPHERTLAAPKADRLKLLRAARANLSSVLLLYEDREQDLACALAPEFEGRALAQVRDEGDVTHHLVRIEDRARIAAVQAFFEDRTLVIADGHHRYETALAYRDERRAVASDASPDAPFEWLLAYFTNAFAPGSLLGPIQRLVRKGPVPTDDAWSARLRGWRERRVFVAAAQEIPHLLAEHLAPLRDRHAFAVDDASGLLRIFSKDAEGDELTVRVVHREVIGGVFGLDERAVREGAIGYPKDAFETARELRAGGGAVALYLRPLSPGDVFRVTARGELLPQKSTFFYPKLPTGLVFRLIEEGA